MSSGQARQAGLAAPTGCLAAAPVGIIEPFVPWPAKQTVGRVRTVCQTDGQPETTNQTVSQLAAGHHAGRAGTTG